MTFRYAAARSSASRIPPGARSPDDQAVVFLALFEPVEELGAALDDELDEASSGELTPVSALRRARALM